MPKESNRVTKKRDNTPKIAKMEPRKMMEKNPMEICCHAAKDGNVELVRSILESKSRDVKVKQVMNYAIRGGHIAVMDLCFHGAKDMEYNMRHVMNLDTMKYLIRMHGGTIRHVESSL